MTPTVTYLNNSDASVEVIPTDEAHRAALPVELQSQIAVLPSGSFLLKNNLTKWITAIHAVWSLKDADDKTQEHTYSSNGYVVPGNRTIIKPLSLTLITPMGRASVEQFGHLRSSGVLDALRWGRADKLRLTEVKVSLDSVIFEDGQIWGPDRKQYYRTLLSGRSALEALAAELKEASGRGEDIKTYLEKVKSESGGTYEETKSRRDYARWLCDSNGPEVLLRRFRDQNALPDFYHDGGKQQ